MVHGWTDGRICHLMEVGRKLVVAGWTINNVNVTIYNDSTALANQSHYSSQYDYIIYKIDSLSQVEVKII